VNRKERLKEKILELLKLNNTPREIGLGVAIGAFIGIMPIYGLHTTLVIIAALLIPRVNRIALLIGANVSVPPTVPFITWIGYSIGRFLLGRDYPVFRWSDFKNFSPEHFLDVYYALVIGSIVEGLICGVMLYFLTVWFVKRRRARAAIS
jgi:uncharacterized protein (TIGR03546 family)